jgi:hypothetical protein
VPWLNNARQSRLCPTLFNFEKSPMMDESVSTFALMQQRVHFYGILSRYVVLVAATLMGQNQSLEDWNPKCSKTMPPLHLTSQMRHSPAPGRCFFEPIVLYCTPYSSSSTFRSSVYSGWLSTGRGLCPGRQSATPRTAPLVSRHQNRAGWSSSLLSVPIYTNVIEILPLL